MTKISGILTGTLIAAYTSIGLADQATRMNNSGLSYEGTGKGAIVCIDQGKQPF